MILLICALRAADGKGSLSSPTLLCLAGLLSASISFRKNWMAI